MDRSARICGAVLRRISVSVRCVTNIMTGIAVPGKKPVDGRRKSGGMPIDRLSLAGIWPELLISFLFMIIFSSVPSNLSMLTAEKSLGEVQVAGIFSTLFLAGGMAAGFVKEYSPRKSARIPYRLAAWSFQPARS